MNYPMTLVEQLNHLDYAVFFRRETGIWCATRNRMFEDPQVFTSSSLDKLLRDVRKHLASCASLR